MSIRVHWYLPTNGDSRDITGSGDGSEGQLAQLTRPVREATVEYLTLVAKAVEGLGYEAVLTPTGAWCADAWIVTAALSQLTSRLKFLVAFRPGLASPTLLAQQAATFQHVSRGRLLLNVVAGGDSIEQRRYGDHLDHRERYDRAAEFLEAFRGIADPDRIGYSFRGRYFEIEDAHVDFGPYGPPPVYLGGASAAGERVGARHGDVYLTWGETPPQIAERVARMRELAEEQDRALSFGIRFHVITRDRAADAWREAEDLVERISPERIAAAREQQRVSESVGQRRMNALGAAARRPLEVSPNVWTGYGLVRAGAGTALVGSHEDVADRIEEYHALGIEHFILSGQPHLEEAYWFAEGVLPILRARGLVHDGGQDT